MEPRPCSRGNEAGKALLIQSQLLQWSHGLAAVETLTAATAPLTVRRLQWSHGLAAVETGRGPRPRTGRAYLQWSHGLAAVETAESNLADGKGYSVGPSLGAPSRRLRQGLGASPDRARSLTPAQSLASGCEGSLHHLAARMSAVMRLSRSGQSDDCVPAHFWDAANAQRADPF